MQEQSGGGVLAAKPYIVSRSLEISSLNERSKIIFYLFREGSQIRGEKVDSLNDFKKWPSDRKSKKNWDWEI